MQVSNLALESPSPPTQERKQKRKTPPEVSTFPRVKSKSKKTASTPPTTLATPTIPGTASDDAVETVVNSTANLDAVGDRDAGDTMMASEASSSLSSSPSSSKTRESTLVPKSPTSKRLASPIKKTAKASKTTPKSIAAESELSSSPPPSASPSPSSSSLLVAPALMNAPKPTKKPRVSRKKSNQADSRDSVASQSNPSNSDALLRDPSFPLSSSSSSKESHDHTALNDGTSSRTATTFDATGISKTDSPHAVASTPTTTITNNATRPSTRSRSKMKPWERMSQQEIEDAPSKYAAARAADMFSQIKVLGKPAPQLLPDSPCPGWASCDPNAMGHTGLTGARWWFWPHLSDVDATDAPRIITLRPLFSGLLVPAKGVGIKCGICNLSFDAKNALRAMRDPWGAKPWTMVCDVCMP